MNGLKRWQQETVAPVVERQPERRAEFRTTSGV
jgi:hypothetical protein